MKLASLIASVAVIASSNINAASNRDYIEIVGSSTVYPFAIAVAVRCGCGPFEVVLRTPSASLSVLSAQLPASADSLSSMLEMLLADARAAGADTVITTGGPQSNHCRLTAAASAQMGMACHVVLGGEEGEVPNGNALLDWLCGAVMHYVQPENRNARMASLSDELKEEGRKPYIVPLGGSNGLGAVGYALAMKELRAQFSGDWNDIDAIIVAPSSGGTQAGLTVGARAFGFERRSATGTGLATIAGQRRAS